MKKRELLHGILPNIGSNLQLQRLFTEYQEQLETIEKWQYTGSDLGIMDQF